MVVKRRQCPTHKPPESTGGALVVGMQRTRRGKEDESVGDGQECRRELRDCRREAEGDESWDSRCNDSLRTSDAEISN